MPTIPVLTIGLLIAPNVVMGLAWYGHLRSKSGPLLTVIAVPWGIPLFKYILQVPDNR